MIITNIQLPNGIVDSKGSKGTQNQEDFLATLTQAIKTNSKASGEIKPDKLASEKELILDDGFLKDEEDFSYDVLSQLGMFLGLSLYENKTSDEISVNVNISDISIGENMETNNTAIPYIVENIAENIVEDQIGLLKSEEGLESDGNILPNDKEIQHLETEFSLELEDMPDTQKARYQEEKLTTDRKIDLNSKNQFKNDEFLHDTNSKVANKVEEENLRPKGNESRVSKDMIFNTYIQANKALEINPEILPEEQVLLKENIQNINETIIRLVETTTEGQTSVMKVQLYPEDLGTVNVVLKMDKGKVSTRIIVDNDHIKQLFISKVNEISDNLVKQNISMDKVEVELNENLSLNANSHHDSGENFNRNNRENFKRNQLFSFEREQVSEDVITDKYSSLSSISILA